MTIDKNVMGRGEQRRAVLFSTLIYNKESRLNTSELLYD
jgi:hypothetical protein